MPSQSPRRIVIIGGVAGGMSAATRLRRLDESASITVFEKGPYVSYANCGIPYALSGVVNDDALILQTPASFKARFNIDVRVNHEAVRIDRKEHTVHVRDPSGNLQQVPYDKLILSQGAAPIRPPIQGLDQGHVFHLTTVPDLADVKRYLAEHDVQHACVIGGGFIGLEAAENLKLLGLDVTVVEMARHVLPPLDQDIAEPLHATLRRNGVRLVLGSAAKKIDTAQVVVGSGEQVPAELVILVLGVRARSQLARDAGLEIGKTGGVVVNAQMQTSDPDVYAVGDMVQTEHRVAKSPAVVALAGPASRQGRLAADHICGRTVSFRGSIGTAVCKVFDTTVGITGLSVDGLRKLGPMYQPLWVSAHPPDHAGYYPGSSPITLKVAFDRDSGRLLGAQAVGAAGVDKRIDILATAISANMTVYDLEHLELAYAPPYGSAKDPVNMVGFIGANVLRGDTHIVHGEDLSRADLDMQVVDVRSPAEFATGHLRGAVNIPVNVLRDNIAKLDMAKPTLVYCQVGYRGYLAYRILRQSGGSNVVNLDGGFKSVVQGGFTELYRTED